MNRTIGTRRVLVCENPRNRGAGIASLLESKAAALRLQVLRAGDRDTAWKLLQSQPIALAIIDVGRESGEALALLRSIARGFPLLSLFVFNGFMIPGFAEKAKEYEQARYCEDARELDRFIQLGLGELAKTKKGTIEGIQLANLLDWLQGERLSGQVVVSSGNRRGILHFREGRLVAADSGTTPGDGTALAEMSSWEKVTIEIQEGGLPERAAPDQQVAAASPLPASAGGERDGIGRSRIETLRLIRGKERLAIAMGELRRIVDSVRAAAGESLLRMDIFLTADGRSLAGWNSQPLACSVFSAITRSLHHALEASRFPALGNYYLIDLAAGQLAAVLVCGDLQVGLLLDRRKLQMGLLTTIILPDTARALARSFSLEPSA